MLLTPVRRSPAWLSLFTMLVLYIAPLISMSISMPLGNDMPTMSVTQHQHVATTKHQHTTTHMSWCAYCDLLPTLHGVFSLILPLFTGIFLLIYRVTSAHYQFHIPLLFSRYHPRAPPLFCPCLFTK